MAQRSDLEILWFLDPRLIRVEGPSAELLVQDLHDTVKDEEDEPGNLIYPELISTAGKETIGTGVLNGLTGTLLNGQVLFDPRTASVSSGTATSADPDGAILTDLAATFIADGVLPGAWIVNFTDQSVGTVIRAISEQQLQLLPVVRGTLRALDDGTDDDWDIGDVYKVWNVVQVELTGGNSVAQDENGDPISAIFPTMGVQVLRTLSTSASLIDAGVGIAAAVWDESNSAHTALNTKGLAVALTEYDSAICISNTGTSGIVVGINGTPSNPVDNLADALTLIDETGFAKFIFLSGSFTLAANLTEFVVELRDESELDLGGQSVNGTQFIGGIVKGTMTGAITIQRSSIEDVTGLLGHCSECGLKGTINLAVGDSAFDRCHSEEPGLGMPVIDFVGAGRTASIRAYAGGLEIRDMVNANNIATVDFVSGQLKIAATCTAGVLVVRGIADPVTDVSLGTTVDITGVVKGSELTDVHKTLTNQEVVEFNGPGDQQLVNYEDDGVTVRHRAPLTTEGGEDVTTQTGVQTRRGKRTL